VPVLTGAGRNAAALPTTLTGTAFMSSPALPDTPAQYLCLHGSDASLVLEVHADEAPLWRYWGPRLPDQCPPGWALRATRYDSCHRQRISLGGRRQRGR
jgi:hypothetical protein